MRRANSSLVAHGCERSHASRGGGGGDDDDAFGGKRGTSTIEANGSRRRRVRRARSGVAPIEP
eukprot:2801643-Prymnesium_polylepis.2